MSENNKNKTPDQLLEERLNQSVKKREISLTKIDTEFEDEKKSVTMSSRNNNKKQKTMKVENPYGTPDPNPKEVVPFDYDDEMSDETIEKNQKKDNEDDKNTNKQILDRDIPNSDVHVAKNTADATSIDNEISKTTSKQTTNNTKTSATQVASQQDTASLNQEAIDMAGEEELRDVLKRDKEWDGKRKKAQMEQLQNKLAQVRDDFVTKKRRTEKMSTKLLSLLGKVDIGNANAEIQQFHENYNNALADVRNLLIEERDAEGTNEDRKKEINANLKFMSINEGIELNEAETKAKLETKMGKIGDKINKVGLWYKKLPKGVKYAMAGAVFATGGYFALTGGMAAAGAGGGLFIFAKGVKRTLGAVAAGVGTSMALEARMKGKRDKQMAEEMKKFSEMSLEEQNVMVAGIDKLDEETQKEFEKIRSQRRKIKFAAVGVAASLMALGTWSTVHDIDKFGAEHATTELSAETDPHVVLENEQQDTSHLEDHSVGVHEGPGTPWLGHEDELMENVKVENGSSNVIKGVISKEGMHDWERMSGGVNKYGITDEQLQNARELPIDDRDKMEEYLIKLAKVHTDENTGEVNKELLHKEVDNAFGQYKLTGKISEVPKIDVDVTPDTGVDDIYDAPYANENINVPQEGYSDNDTIESRASMQADASDIADNPTQEGILYEDNDVIENQAGLQSDASEMVDNPMSQGFNHIEIDANNIGTLTVEKGNSIEGFLIKFLESNSDKLTEGGMGWDANDPRWGGDVHKWAGARAHGLAQEFAKSNHSIDLDKVDPGTKLNLDLNNPADVKLDIDFENGPHIIPEEGKVEILGQENNMEAKLDNDILEKLSTTKEVVHAFGLTEDQFVEMANEPVSKILDTAGPDPAKWTSLERTLSELNGVVDGGIADKTVGEVVGGTDINILKNISDIATDTGTVNTDVAHEVVGNVAQEATEQATEANPFEGMTESEILQEFVGNRELKIAVATEMMHTFGSEDMTNVLKNIAPVQMDTFLNGGDSVQAEAVNSVRDKAVAVFGKMAEPKPGATVGNYFTRIFTKAILEGKVKDVFPESNFTLKK